MPSREHAIVPGCDIDHPDIERGLRSGRYIHEDGALHKKCIYCREYWPCDLEFFYAQPERPDGLNSACKACYLERRRTQPASALIRP